MSISFSGLASGLDTSSWVESLVALKRAKVTALQEEKETVLLSKDTLNSIKSFFSSFRSTIEKITDSKFNIVSMDLFAQNLATSANLNVLTASATTEAEEGTYKVKVDKLASKTNATSNFKYTTTVVETTTATSDSLLKHLGVSAGTVGVTVDGIKHGVAITESDTIATFIEKLQNIGVEASFNETSGVFSMNISEGDIDDTIDNTGIVNALHLEGVNEGYKTVDRLEIQKVETEWTPANSATLMKDLGVNAGTIEITANDDVYDITIDDTTTLGEFITALRDNDIDANLSSAGIFTLLDASITNEGSTNIITAMNLQTDIYSKTQATGALTHQTITTETTTATSATLLKDIGEGTAIADGQTVIVKNSNNEYTTINVGEATTIGELLADMSNAGLYAAIDSNGIVEISGGTITGGTFDAVSALGLETEPYTAMVTGDSLTETIVEHELVNMDTRLVDDLGVTEGYLEVTDADGNTFYEKIYSGQTIGDLMADLANLGIYSTLDEENGILEITGGAFTTLTDADVQALVGNNTIAEPDARYQKGTNLLECLYGAGTISTEHIEVASAYSRTRALTYSTTNLVNATLDTTLGTLGLSDGTAIFDVRGEEVTINVTSDMTVQGLIDELSANGIESSWDEDFSRITINNTTLTGGSSNLADVLNLTTEVAGKYVTSDTLNSQTTVAIDATRDTLLNELGVNTTETVVLNKENGTTYTFSVDGTTDLGTILDTLNSNGVTAKLENGILSIDGGYLDNTTLESALGLSSSVLGYSNILGNKVTHTITTTATGDNTLGEIITALGTESAVSGGYDLSFNSNAISVDADTTLDELMQQIHSKGGVASFDSTGRLHIDGGTLTGSVATALGISSVSTTAAVGATGEILETITTINADTSTKLSELGLGASTISVCGTDGVTIGTITTTADMTIGDVFTALAGYGISGTITNGVINLTSDTDRYAIGGVLASMGVGTTSSTYTTTAGTTVTSTAPVTYTSTTYTTTFPTITQTVNTTHTIVVTSPTVGTQTITVTDTIVTTEPVIGTSTVYITETVSSTHTLNVVKTVTVQTTSTLTIDATSTTTVDAIATEDTTLGELGLTLADLSFGFDIYQNGNLEYEANGTEYDYYNLSWTIGELVADINDIVSSDVLVASFDNGVITLTQNPNADNDYTEFVMVGPLAEALGIEVVSSGTTTTAIATEDTTFKELGITNETISNWDVWIERYLTTDGSDAGAVGLDTFDEDTTLKEFISVINNTTNGDFAAQLYNGVITINDATPDDGYDDILTGELIEALGIEVERTDNTVTTTVGVTITSTETVVREYSAYPTIKTLLTSTAAVTYTTAGDWTIACQVGSGTARLTAADCGAYVDGAGSIQGTGTIVAVTSDALSAMENHSYDGYHFVLVENVTLELGRGIELKNSTFDGQGYIIDCSSADLEYQQAAANTLADTYALGGIFSNVYGSTIKNVNVVGINTAQSYDPGLSGANIGCGALIGVAISSTIENCRVEIETFSPAGKLNESSTSTNTYYAGGLVGITNQSEINNCEVSGGQIAGSLWDNNYSGGIVGYQFKGTISNCSVSLEMLTSGGNTGGLVGYRTNGTLEKCWVGGSWYLIGARYTGIFTGSGTYASASSSNLISCFSGVEVGSYTSYTYTAGATSYNSFWSAVSSSGNWARAAATGDYIPVLHIDQGWYSDGNNVAVYDSKGKLQGFAWLTPDMNRNEMAAEIRIAGASEGINAFIAANTGNLAIENGYIADANIANALNLITNNSTPYTNGITGQTGTISGSSTVTVTATSSTTVDEIIVGKGMTGYLSVYSTITTIATIFISSTDGDNYEEVTTININKDSTIDSLNEALGDYGTISIEDGIVTIEASTGYKLDLTPNGTSSLSLILQTWEFGYNGYAAETLIDESGDEIIYYETLSMSSTLSDFEDDFLDDVENNYRFCVYQTGTDTLITSCMISQTTTVQDLADALEDYATVSVSDGKLSIAPNSGYYVKIERDGSDDFSELHLNSMGGYNTNITSGSFHFSNTDSDVLLYTISSTTTSNTDSDVLTFESIVEAGTHATITVVSTGTATITVQETMTSDQTVIHTIVSEETTTKLVTHTVTATFTVENTTTAPITLTVVGTGTIETTTVSISATDTTVPINYATNLFDLIAQKGVASGSVYTASIGTTEGIKTFLITDSMTLGDYAAELAAYGINLSINSENKIVVTSTDGNYIVDWGQGGVDSVCFALNLNKGNNVTYTTTVHTTYDNTASNQLKQTITANATGLTQLQDLRNESGVAPSGYSLVLSTTSDAGNQNVTLTFSATSTVYDVIDELANYGLNASIDSSGRFAVNSSSLTDFDISGDLGTFLMGSYTKVYDEGQVSSVSTNLIQQTVVNIDDSTLLSKIGITNGNLVLYKDGTEHIITIDNTKSIGDFRTTLAEYGLTSSIIDGRLQISSDGIVYFTEPASDASNIISVLGLDNNTGGGSDSSYEQYSKHLYDTETNVVTATMSDKISLLTDSSGNSLGITAGQIYVYQNGSRNTLNIDTNDTLQDLAAKLSQYGITMGISSDGKLYFDGNNNSYMTTDGIASGSASNILTKFNVLNNWSTRYNSTSETLDYEVEEDAKVNGSTLMTELQDADGNSLGITEGNYYVYQNGVRTTESIGADTTVDDFISTLATYGMTASFDESGALSVGGYNETYLATAATAGDNTNAIAVLFEQWNFTNIYTSNNLDIPTDVTVAISETTKLADINEGAYQAGYITVIKDGVQTDIELTADDTVGDLMDELALYGFESVINANGQLIIKNTGDSLLQNYTGVLQASNALDLLGVGLDDWISTNTYESSSVTVTTTTTEDVSSTRDTLLSDMGVTTGEYYIWKDGVKYTAYISSDETLGSLIDTLQGFGIETSLVDTGAGSILSIEGNGDCYIAKSASTTNSSNVVEQLFTAPSSENYAYSGLQQTSELVTTYSAATEDTLLSYFDVGVLQAQGDLSVTIDGVTSTVQVEPDETIGSLLTKFNALGLEATLSDGHIVVQSGYKEFTINTDGTTSSMPATLNLVFNDDLGGYIASNDTVTQTTTTVEEKTVSVANYADYGTKMSLLNIANGTLTLYRDGEKATLNIDSNQTFGDLRAQISGRFADVDIKFEDGFLTFFSTTDGVRVEVGATTDTSNFAAITGIQSTGEGSVKSARELYCANSSSVITTAGLFRNGDVKAGTFKIGDAEFTITDSTTISALISQINASQSANATAYWDSVDGKLVIQSRTTGAALVNIEAGTSNFTDIMGFTNSEWADTDGDGDPDIGESLATVTKMNVNAQEVGDNARFSINGTYYTSTSNTIGSDVSRIKGVTINLKGISEGETTLTIERDKESIANAVSDVVDAYNDLIENVDKEIAKGSPLDDQFTLKLLRNQIRSLMTSSIGGTGVFKNLDAVGISLNAATAGDIRTDNINVLNFDKDKFIDAFDADRDALKDLLVGTDANLGIFQRVENIVENAITASYGYFQSAENSYNKQISRIDEKIKKAETALERYKERLEAKFASMDLLISQIQNQYSSFLSAG